MTSILDQALSMEKAGRRYYSTLARKSNSKEAAGVLAFLADEEANHYDEFMNLHQREGTAASHPVHNSKAARRIFRKMAEEAHGSPVITDAETVYLQALRLKEKSLKHYASLLASIDKSEEDALKEIIEEEKRYARSYEELVDFTRIPKDWLENAEFNHHSSF